MPTPLALKNLDKGVGRNGRTLQDIWRSKGFSEEEIQQKTQDRYDLIRISRARNMAARLGKDAEEFGLGASGVKAVKIIEKTKKDLNKEFKASPLKGVRHQNTTVKKQQQAQKNMERHQQRVANPKIKGLQGVPGLKVDADGKIGLAELKKQRPDLIYMKELPSPKTEAIHQERLAKGRRDWRYEKRFGVDKPA